MIGLFCSNNESNLLLDSLFCFNIKLIRKLATYSISYSCHMIIHCVNTFFELFLQVAEFIYHHCNALHMHHGYLNFLPRISNELAYDKRER